MLTHADIAARIPHSGNMCLLAQVLAWDAQSLSASAPWPVAEAHPLACSGQVSGLAWLEYAAQATAVHGALLAGGVAPAGRLVSLRQVEYLALPVVGLPLRFEVQRLLVQADGTVYGFAVFQDDTCTESCLARGRLGVLWQQQGS